MLLKAEPSQLCHKLGTKITHLVVKIKVMQMSKSSKAEAFLIDELSQGTFHVLVPQAIDEGVHHRCHHSE